MQSKRKSAVSTDKQLLNYVNRSYNKCLRNNQDIIHRNRSSTPEFRHLDSPTSLVKKNSLVTYNRDDINSKGRLLLASHSLEEDEKLYKMSKNNLMVLAYLKEKLSEKVAMGEKGNNSDLKESVLLFTSYLIDKKEQNLKNSKRGHSASTSRAYSKPRDLDKSILMNKENIRDERQNQEFKGMKGLEFSFQQDVMQKSEKFERKPKTNKIQEEKDIVMNKSPMKTSEKSKIDVLETRNSTYNKGSAKKSTSSKVSNNSPLQLKTIKDFSNTSPLLQKTLPRVPIERTEKRRYRRKASMHPICVKFLILNLVFMFFVLSKADLGKSKDQLCEMPEIELNDEGNYSVELSETERLRNLNLEFEKMNQELEALMDEIEEPKQDMFRQYIPTLFSVSFVSLGLQLLLWACYAIYRASKN